MTEALPPDAALPLAGPGDGPGAATPASPNQRARADQLRLFLAHWRGSLVAIALGTATAALAWGTWIPLSWRLGWCGLAAVNYLAQALVCWRMDRAPVLADAMPQLLPWLQATVAGSGVVWGLVPWMVSASANASTAVLLFAGMFNMLLIFSVVNAPCNRAMVYCAVLPVALLTSTALLRWPGLLLVGLGCAALCTLVLLYGLKVQAAVQATMVERHTAHDLADALRRQQQRLVALEAERTRLLERQRLMRDLHDGMGSTLASALVSVEHGQVSTAEVAGLLRDCVNDLRAVVDSLDPINLDVVSLLAATRFRIGPQLQRLGIALEWDMQDLPPLPWFGPSEALQVMRLVQEVFTNLIRHAGAHRVQVQAWPTGDGVALRVADDGCGFEPGATTPGRGLRLMAQRALALGGELELQAAPGRGTAVRLVLPLQRPAQPVAG